MTIKKTTANVPNVENNNKQDTRVRSANKRPRAPIACFRCHHKKVRCDGARPNCTRCLSTGVLCAYPSSRRSRTTQPANVDPFIDNLSQLEARIRRIEIDLEKQRNMVHSIFSNPVSDNPTSKASDLANTMKKTENEVQESKSIIAQLRLRGEQRISRTKRAAASEQKTQEKETPKTKKKQQQQQEMVKSESTPTTERYNPSFYYQNMMLDNHSDISSYDAMGHGMDWTLFDPENISQHEFHDTSMISPNAFMPNVGPTASLSAPPLMSRRMMEKDMMDHHQTASMISPPPTRSSSLVSNYGPKPSSSTTSTNTTTALSSTSSVTMNICDSMFNFPIDTMLLQGESQDHHHIESNQPWYYS
ncbi:hypothetical protein K501DRAFT_309283 [Backusella circina FSU 941]|nr:hypothetical protein K501DRAFT_309283 [Backusella circina FSU 941]